MKNEKYFGMLKMFNFIDNYIRMAKTEDSFFYYDFITEYELIYNIHSLFINTTTSGKYMVLYKIVIGTENSGPLKLFNIML